MSLHFNRLQTLYRIFTLWDQFIIKQRATRDFSWKRNKTSLMVGKTLPDTKVKLIKNETSNSNIESSIVKTE